MDNGRPEGVERIPNKPIIPYVALAIDVHKTKHKITEVAIKRGI